MRYIFIYFIIFSLFVNCTETKEKKHSASEEQINYFSLVSSIKLPDKLTFCGESVPLDIPEVKERAERELYLLMQQPGQIILYIKRAGTYFPVFERIIKEEGLPDDLKFLSVAESALYMARSAKDAVGLWQFMAATGKKMGLQIDDYVDERRHPAKSTKAAMKYLKSGFDSQKSWIMAAAGYNMGHENLKDNTEFQGSNNFFDLFLNEETSRYILRIAIIKEIMENPQKYGLDRSKLEIYKPDKVNIITVANAIPNLSDWAQKNGTTYKYVKLLNPWILKRELPHPKSGNSYEIAIPAK